MFDKVFEAIQEKVKNYLQENTLVATIIILFTIIVLFTGLTDDKLKKIISRKENQ